MRIITLVTSYIFFSCLFFSSAEENSKPAWLGIVTSKVDPIVATQLDLPEGTVENEILDCESCDVELEVVSLDPPTVELAPEEQEDWGE